MRFTLIAHDRDLDRSRYRIEDERGWCEVTLWHKDNPGRLLGPFGGSVWPSSFPDVFTHVGPDEGLITSRSGPAFRPDVVLPERF